MARTPAYRQDAGPRKGLSLETLLAELVAHTGDRMPGLVLLLVADRSLPPDHQGGIGSTSASVSSPQALGSNAPNEGTFPHGLSGNLRGFDP